MFNRLLAWTALSLMLSTCSAHAQGCDGVNTQLSPHLRKRYGEIIRLASKPSPKLIAIDGYLGQSSWAIVFAHVAGAERAAFVFRHENNRHILVDTWGGVAGPDSAESIALWAKGLSPSFPVQLANCFGQEIKSRF